MKKQIKVAYFPSNTAKDVVLGSNGKSLDKYCTKCGTEEDLTTGNYILDATFLIEDNLQDLLQEEVILKVLMDYGNEIFRISKVTKGTRYIDIVARQITIADSLTLWLEDVRPTNLDGTAAGDYLVTNATGTKEIEISSDIGTLSTAYYQRMSLYKALHDCDQSFLNRWGGEILRRGYIEYINSAVGIDRGFVIRQSKNLSGFEYSSNVDNLITRARGKGYNGILGNYIDSPLINNYNRIYTDVIEYQDVKVKDENSDDGYDTESLAIAELDRRIGLEYSDNDIDKIKAAYDLSFVQLEKTQEYKNYVVAERVYLGDTIRVYIPKLNTDIKVRATNKKYDCLAQKTKEVKLSNYVEFKALSMKAIIADLKTQYAQSNNNSIASYIDAIIKAGMKGSYVVLRNNELLIMDDKDINSATNVTRYNKNGLAFSTTGYYGTFTYGFTIDGKINASLIVTGILNASVIKAGILKSANNKTWINMEDGTFNFADKITFDGANFVINADAVKIAVGQIGVSNLLKNSKGQFDKTNWTYYSTDSVNRITAMDGYFKYRRNGSTYTNWTDYQFYQNISTVVGKKYTYSIWYMSPYGAQAKVEVLRTSDYVPSLTAQLLVSSTSVWKKLSFTFTANDATQSIRFFFGLTANDVDFNFYAKVEEGENATAWSPNPNELKSNIVEITDNHLRATFQDGSYSEMVPEGFHHVSANGTYEYHYLSYTGNADLGYLYNGTNTPFSVNLPAEFKNKNISASIAISECSGEILPSFIKSFYCNITSIDNVNLKLNGECFARAYSQGTDGIVNDACGVFVVISYTVFA